MCTLAFINAHKEPTRVAMALLSLWNFLLVECPNSDRRMVVSGSRYLQVKQPLTGGNYPTTKRGCYRHSVTVD